MSIVKVKTDYRWIKTGTGVNENMSAREQIASIVRTLQKFVKDVFDDIRQLQPNIVSSLPTAEKDKRGSFLILDGASADDKLYFCIQNAADGYEWKEIQFV